MPRYINLENFQQLSVINLTSDPGYDPNDRHIPNVASITLAWMLADGIMAHNVLHGQYQGAFAGSQAQADSILTSLVTGAQWTALAPFLASTTILLQVQIRDLNTVDQPIIMSLASGGIGQSTDLPMPAEVAAVVTLRTAFTGPQNRGRMYIPGWAVNAQTANDGIISGAYTALQNWASIISGVLQAQGYQFGIGHYSRQAYTGVSGKQHPARPPGLVPITNVALRDQNWDSQRRRGRK